MEKKLQITLGTAEFSRIEMRTGTQSMVAKSVELSSTVTEYFFAYIDTDNKESTSSKSTQIFRYIALLNNTITGSQPYSRVGTHIPYTEPKKFQNPTFLSAG